MTSQADSLRIQLQADSLRANTLTEGIVLTPPESSKPVMREMEGPGSSVAIAVLLLFFTIVAFRVRNNGRYLSSLIYDLTEVRERHNVFDDTVRETSLLVLLNILWCLSAGVVLWVAAVTYTPGTDVSPRDGIEMALCAGVALVYEAIMSAAYFIIGDVFNDRAHAGMWLRGFLASQAMMSVPLLPIALLLLAMPQWTPPLLIAAGVALVIAKLLFIWKGFRIFFTRISSWVLFLYYLCSLEIIPLILIYAAASLICASVP